MFHLNSFKKITYRKLLFVILIASSLVILSCVPKQVIESKSLQPQPAPPKPARIALVLGAGASKGFAHIGVLKVLESNRIPVHMIVGTSVGSLVGSLYACGYNAFQLQAISISLERDDLIDLTLPDNGFVKGEKIENYVNKMVKNTPIDKLRIPFYAVATDVRTGEEVIFGMGNTGKAVRSSCSIPGVFQSTKIAGRTYVDGGVVSPLGIDAARKYGADVVIAVDISSSLDNSVPVGTIDTILQAVNIMYSKISLIQLSRADVVIRPDVGSIGSADFSKRHDAIIEGEKAALAALPEINAIVLKLRQEGRLPQG
jgi:NTE family protein